MTNFDALARTLADILGGERWPPPLARFISDVEYLRKRLEQVCKKIPDEEELKKTRSILGSLVLGEAAERIFEQLYKSILSTTEIQLVDQRESRTDTDYRLVNGQGRPLYRINIKFHGALFRNAKEVVGLEPRDCFPLATYKIKSALEKQDREHLPYLFVVVTGSEVSAEIAGSQIPTLLVMAAHCGKLAISSGKRNLEERAVARFIVDQEDQFRRITQSIQAARWYVFSARRAEAVMKDKLFDRVFALRTRSFNRAYRNAEIDMHLSFSEDMIPLKDFLDMIASEGHFRLAGMLERGTI